MGGGDLHICQLLLHPTSIYCKNLINTWIKGPTKPPQPKANSSSCKKERCNKIEKRGERHVDATSAILMLRERERKFVYLTSWKIDSRKPTQSPCCCQERTEIIKWTIYIYIYIKQVQQHQYAKNKKGQTIFRQLWTYHLIIQVKKQNIYSFWPFIEEFYHMEEHSLCST